MNTMQYDTSFVRVVSASLLGILIAFGLNGAVLAAVRDGNRTENT